MVIFIKKFIKCLTVNVMSALVWITVPAAAGPILELKSEEPEEVFRAFERSLEKSFTPRIELIPSLRKNAPKFNDPSPLLMPGETTILGTEPDTGTEQIMPWTRDKMPPTLIDLIRSAPPPEQKKRTWN